jgi:hypothetical protein
MARRKHQPQRICLACRTVQPKRELVRIVRTPDQQVVVDFTGKANGRGVYVCRNAVCWEKALIKERLSHALKVTVTQDHVDALKEALQTELKTNS